MRRLCFSIFLAVCIAVLADSARAHGEAAPSDFGLREGDPIQATSVGDFDVYIISATGHKRLVLNPTIFSFYGHFQWRGIREVGVGVRDAFRSSALVRNCETGDPKVYAVEVTEEDRAVLHWMNMTAETAIAEDDDFFKKVFCINSREFFWYTRGAEYTSTSQITVYDRSYLPPPGANDTSLPLSLPSGFRISVFTPQTTLGPLRMMAVSPDGILFVSMSSSAGLYGGGARDGKIYALPDRNGDGVADEARTVLSNLDLAHGLAFYNNYLYVAEETTVARYSYLGDMSLGARQVIISGLPSGGGHVSRTIGFSPAGKLYVSVGSSCNACTESDPQRAVILEYNADGTGEKVFARGLRNSVGFVFHPITGEIWATDNGRDYLGDNLPPDEINIVRSGGHYGWPLCYGKSVVDPAYGTSSFCATAIATTHDIQAHSAALGLRFIGSTHFPESWQGDLLVAYHGSWNRTEPTGYKVARLQVSGNSIVAEEDFVSGWLRPDGAKLGRPVDVAFGADGALYISDDKANIIYRVVKN